VQQARYVAVDVLHIMLLLMNTAADQLAAAQA
jgi:hypothetical protein